MKTLSTVLMTVLLSLITGAANADYNVDQGAILKEGPQDVVITFSQDLGELRKNGKVSHLDESSVEQACLALTLAQMLRNPMMNGGNEDVNVSVFLRNDGVKLADTELVSAISEAQERNKAPGCIVPWYGYPITLTQHLADFLAGPGGNNDLVNCPICWCAYKGFTDPVECSSDYTAEPPYPGVLNPAAVPPLFLGADKVVDF